MESRIRRYQPPRASPPASRLAPARPRAAPHTQNPSPMLHLRRTRPSFEHLSNTGMPVSQKLKCRSDRPVCKLEAAKALGKESCTNASPATRLCHIALLLRLRRSSRGSSALWASASPQHTAGRHLSLQNLERHPLTTRLATPIRQREQQLRQITSRQPNWHVQPNPETTNSCSPGAKRL